VIRRVLAGVAALLGVMALVAGSPYAERRDVGVARLASAIAHEDDHITAVELAEWIRDRKPGLRVIDLRTEEKWIEYHLPRAERLAIESLASASFKPAETIVLVSGGGAHAAQAWILLQTMGHRQVYFLRGGMREWIDDVMNPTIAADASPATRAAFQRVSDVSRYFGGVPRVVDKMPAKSDDDIAAAAAVRRRGC
jgi:rhodanese-related sulfurtransferase